MEFHWDSSNMDKLTAKAMNKEQITFEISIYANDPSDNDRPDGILWFVTEEGDEIANGFVPVAEKFEPAVELAKRISALVAQEYSKGYPSLTAGE